MKRGPARRISELERRTGKGCGAFIVVELADGMDADAALAALGLAKGPADLVVVGRHFSAEIEPTLVNRRPLVRSDGRLPSPAGRSASARR